MPGAVIRCCGPCTDKKPLGHITGGGPDAGTQYLCEACGIAYRAAHAFDGHPTGVPPTRAHYDHYVPERAPGLYDNNPPTPAPLPPTAPAGG